MDGTVTAIVAVTTAAVADATVGAENTELSIEDVKKFRSDDTAGTFKTFVIRVMIRMFCNPCPV